MKLRLILGILIGIASLEASAHPTSYKGAVGIMSYNSAKMNELLLTYSFSPNFAVAGTYLRDSKSDFYIPRLNFLAKRWNNSDSQANFYLSGGSGVEKFDSKTTPAHLGEVVLDWESRQYYTYVDHVYIKRDNKDNLLIPNQDYNHTKLRLGMAPFLADYEELNIWLIAQFEKHNDEKQIDATQFVRFYRKNMLWEIGAGFDGSLAFNFMVHL
jgi:hypothetical protein